MTAQITVPASLEVVRLHPLFALSFDIRSVQEVVASGGVNVVGVVGGGRFEGAPQRPGA